MTRGALREAHAHIPAHGRAMSMLRAGDCLNKEELLDLLGRAGGTGWVLAAGARVNAWTDPRWPDRSELDRVQPDRPCCVMSFDHHSIAANTAAMRAAGMSEDEPDPPGGVICRDARTGTPTGLLLESAAMRVWHSAPEPGESERRAHVLAALKDLATHGFTEVHDLLSPAWLGPLLASLDADGLLPYGVRLYASWEELESQHAAATGPRGWERPRVRLAGAKCFADGTLNSRTAWMIEPYRDPLPGLPLGKPMMTAAELDSALALTRAKGLELAVHAIGDGAVRAVLDARERAGRESPPLRIEHCELIDRSDVVRFAELGVAASVQPCHLLADIEVLTRELPHRLHRVLPLRDLIDEGCAPGRGVWFGSDVPIVRPDPEDSIRAAVHRGRAEGGPVIALEQAITEVEAWRCFAPEESVR